METALYLHFKMEKRPYANEPAVRDGVCLRAVSPYRLTEHGSEEICQQKQEKGFLKILICKRFSLFLLRCVSNFGASTKKTRRL